MEHDINRELLERVGFYIDKPSSTFSTKLEPGEDLVMTLRYHCSGVTYKDLIFMLLSIPSKRLFVRQALC